METPCAHLSYSIKQLVYKLLKILYLYANVPVAFLVFERFKKEYFFNSNLTPCIMCLC